MTYNSHIITNPGQLLEEEKNCNLSYDRREMVVELKSFAQFLALNGICRLAQFCRLFKNFGLSANEIGNLIKHILTIISPNFLPTQRAIKKANSSEKNLIFTYIALKADDKFPDVICEYFNQIFPNFSRKDDLIRSYLKLNSEIVGWASKNNQILDYDGPSYQIKYEDSNEYPSEPTLIQPKKRVLLPGIKTFEFKYEID